MGRVTHSAQRINADTVESLSLVDLLLVGSGWSSLVHALLPPVTGARDARPGFSNAVPCSTCCACSTTKQRHAALSHDAWQPPDGP